VSKCTTVAAEIEIGLHVLLLIRAETDISRHMLVESFSKRAEPMQISAALRDSLESIGAQRLDALAHVIAAELGDTEDRACAIEFTGAIAGLFESAGLKIDDHPIPKQKQPGLSTGLPLQFIEIDRD
jgi:hypothetical protein